MILKCQKILMNLMKRKQHSMKIIPMEKNLNNLNQLQDHQQNHFRIMLIILSHKILNLLILITSKIRSIKLAQKLVIKDLKKLN
jgi:hypothetical protein